MPPSIPSTECLAFRCAYKCATIGGRIRSRRLRKPVYIGFSISGLPDSSPVLKETKGGHA